MLKLSKLILAIKILLLLLFFILTIESAYAQEAPFRFNLNPSYEDGKITYEFNLRKTVDWNMTDVTIKIPIPEGTRFLEATAIPSIETTFDGKEVAFFTSVFHRNIGRGSAFFTVEVTNPTMTVFTTNAWISWKGDYPGDYLTNEVDFDITRKPLNWDQPPLPRLQLEATATVDNEIITYYIYPKNTGGRRMWDVKINVPVPQETTFLSADVSPPFVSNFDGQEISFFAIELASEAEIGPLSFKVSTENVTDPYVTTHAWAVWKNSHRKVGIDIVFQEDIRTGDIVVEPHTSGKSIVSDMIADVPFPYYDVTSIVFQEDNDALKVNFHVVEPLELTDQPVNFALYVDADCLADTGTLAHIRPYGMDHIIRYRHAQGEAEIVDWDEETENWLWNADKIKLKSLVEDNKLTIWVPYEFFHGNQQFCWEGQAWTNTQEFNPGPPRDLVLGSEILSLTQYKFTKPIIVNETNISNTETQSPIAEPILIQEYLIGFEENWRYLKGFGEASYPTTDWQQIDYVDTGWLEGTSGIGYSEEDNATVLEDMQDNYLSVFMRHVFNVPDPTGVQSLILEIDYDDGFVAYLNGTEVARRNMGTPGDLVTYNTKATTDRNADNAELIDISDFSKLLQPGKNVLAIQGHNDNEFSRDFSVKPALRWQYLIQPVDPSTDNPVEIAQPESSPETSTFTLSPQPSITDITGKLAVPIDTGQVTYDTHIFSLPNGQEITKIPNARQPDFRFDGQQVLINREGGGVENVFEYNFVDGTEKQVSDAPQDWHPVYDPWGNRVAYGNAELTTGRPEPLRNSSGGIVHGSHDTDIIYNTPRKPFIFVQCGLLPPHQETDPRCRDIPNLGVLIPAGRVGEIQGTHPVWASNDMIAYKGCNTWLVGSQCGIYTVPSASTVGFSDGFIPRRLTKDASDTPTDTKDNLIAFMSTRDGNWEAYVMDLNGDGLRNLSNSPESNDGLPTISPDGNWVAFVSDRGGQWAVWATPTAGGSVQKLFDLPSNTPWGDDDRSWTNERISWGP